MDLPRNWTFKAAGIADGFDTHVREQLPWYDLMSGATAHIARHFIPEGGVVYDLGCATGNIGNLLRETLEVRRCEFIPVDNSEEMREKYSGPGNFQVQDIATMSIRPFDVAIAFLSLMFVPLKARKALIAGLRNAMQPGGAIIIVDKMESSGGYLGTAISRLTLAGKAASGVNPEQIIAKELSLIGVQRPLAGWELRPAVEVFRFGEFAGWVLE